MHVDGTWSTCGHVCCILKATVGVLGPYKRPYCSSGKAKGVLFAVSRPIWVVWLEYVTDKNVCRWYLKHLLACLMHSEAVLGYIERVSERRSAAEVRANHPKGPVQQVFEQNECSCAARALACKRASERSRGGASESPGGGYCMSRHPQGLVQRMIVGRTSALA